MISGETPVFADTDPEGIEDDRTIINLPQMTVGGIYFAQKSPGGDKGEPLPETLNEVAERLREIREKSERIVRISSTPEKDRQPKN